MCFIDAVYVHLDSFLFVCLISGVFFNWIETKLPYLFHWISLFFPSQSSVLSIWAPRPFYWILSWFCIYSQVSLFQLFVLWVCFAFFFFSYYCTLFEPTSEKCVVIILYLDRTVMTRFNLSEFVLKLIISFYRGVGSMRKRVCHII